MLTQIVVTNQTRAVVIQWTHGLIASVHLLAAPIASVRTMTTVTEPQGLARRCTFNQPFDCTYNVSLGRLTSTGAVINQYTHIGVAVLVTEEVRANIVGVIDAAVQLGTRTIVVDSNHNCPFFMDWSRGPEGAAGSPSAHFFKRTG